MVPFGPGGTTDILAGAVAPELSKAFNQQFVVENKAGAGGNLGAEQVAKSAGDGSVNDFIRYAKANPASSTWRRAATAPRSSAGGPTRMCWRDHLQRS